jgi:CrtC N-terminal lipocalin domain
MWQPKTNALNYDCKGMTGSWSYSDGGDKMKIVLNYHNNTQPTKSMSFDFNLTGGKQVMWTKDSVYNKEGFLQEGGPGNVSFYYSLPRLDLSCNVSYIDQSGSNQTLDVTGQAWVDIQWGDWNTRAWEWSSLRFDNGARVNLYSFGNSLEGGKPYLVGTYQKPDGSLQWFDNFTIKQNGYTKLSNGAWVSFGWSYDFPINIEGSKHYTLVPLSNPFSKNPPVDVLMAPTNPRFFFIEQGGQIIDDTTGKVVGLSFTESMPIQLLKNGPYDVNQH